MAAMTVSAVCFCILLAVSALTLMAGRWLGERGPRVNRTSVIVAFLCFGVLTVISRRLAPLLRQETWPRPVNTAVNVGLVLGGFDAGFRVDRWIG